MGYSPDDVIGSKGKGVFFRSAKSVEISGVARVESRHEMTLGLKVGYSVADVIGTSGAFREGVSLGSSKSVQMSGAATVESRHEMTIGLKVGYSPAAVIGSSGGGVFLRSAKS